LSDPRDAGHRGRKHSQPRREDAVCDQRPDRLPFGVNAGGSLTNQREFGTLQDGGGAGSAVDQQGRLYVATGKSVDVFLRPTASSSARFRVRRAAGLHGTFFGGKDRKTLFGIVFYGTAVTERAKRDHGDSDHRAGLYGPCEIVKIAKAINVQAVF
jgi:sugar lactone lactonase YvrE